MVRAHRGHRLGLLMKADMLRVGGVRPAPGARPRSTPGTTATNHHMIAINERLGCTKVAARRQGSTARSAESTRPPQADEAPALPFAARRPRDREVVPRAPHRLRRLAAGADGMHGRRERRRGDEADTASTKAPVLGACRLLDPRRHRPRQQRLPRRSPAPRSTPPQTFAVGTFPAAGREGRPDARALGAYVYDQCKPAFRRFVGADDSLVLRSTLTWAWFRSVEGRVGRRRAPLAVRRGRRRRQVRRRCVEPARRRAKGLLLGRPDDRWMVCVNGPSVNGSPKIPCSRAAHLAGGHHDRAREGEGRPTPATGSVEVRTRDFCSDSVGAWMNYPIDYDYGYTWFHAAEWKAGNRRSICWAKTDQ